MVFSRGCVSAAMAVAALLCAAATLSYAVPTSGGYVISVIRDILKASMGLLDYLGRPKWSEADWSWQRDTLCLLEHLRSSTQPKHVLPQGIRPLLKGRE